jgi:hypothetical protein
MGYTHYFTQPADFTEDQWTALKKDIDSIMTNAYFIPTELTMDETVICLNGVGADSHETLVIYRNVNRDGWDFCKTARKPYDDIVTAILLRLVYSYNYTASSDGSWSDWQSGRNLYAATFNAMPTNIFNRRPQEVI